MGALSEKEHEQVMRTTGGMNLPGKVTCRKCGAVIPVKQSGTVKVEWLPDSDIEKQLPAFTTAFRVCLHCAADFTKGKDE